MENQTHFFLAAPTNKQAITSVKILQQQLESGEYLLTFINNKYRLCVSWIWIHLQNICPQLALSEL